MNADYMQIYENKNITEAERSLKEQGFAFYIYFETPFMIYYKGFNDYKKAKRTHKEILNNKKNDLYGCVLNIQQL